MVIANFYETAYLLCKNYPIAQIGRDENGKKLYHFIDKGDSMIKEIEEFRNDTALQEYTTSIVRLRNLNKDYYRKWDRENSTDEKKTVNPVSEA